MFVERKPPGTELIDLLDRVLDKGTVIDASQRLHLFVIDLHKMRTRVVVDSVETYLGHSRDSAAELTGRNLLDAVDHSDRPTTAPKRRRAAIRRPRSNSA
ncbi:MAG: gas vesicle protein GvpJ [Candidatus Korobacteraceae bacterium]